MLSFTEENYLKALLHLTEESKFLTGAGTNEIASFLKVKPATVNDMLKKLKEKELVDYRKYGKTTLTREGKKKAIEVVRRHRLWETFLFEKLGFTWDEVHEVAEQLEHIQSAKLVDRLDKFLGHPAIDPHGDLIPTSKGELKPLPKRTLNEEVVGHICTMVGVKDNSASFLRYVDRTGIAMNQKIAILSRQSYDSSLEIKVKGKRSSVSPKFASNIWVVCNECQDGVKKKTK